MLKMPKSKRGAMRQCSALIRRAYRDMSGGLQFGLDWPTFAASYPAEAAHIRAMQEAFRSLPD
jgi:hypothetical protein